MEVNELKVLYVEDEDDIRERLSKFLKRRVKELYIAKNGKEGLETYKITQPDIVVTDIQMPIMDGLDMAENIKKIKPEQIVIVTTAFNEEEIISRAMDIGIDEYLFKPISRDSLVKILESSKVE
jgi:YesN/AraC family two-component response regulator